MSLAFASVCGKGTMAEAHEHANNRSVALDGDEYRFKLTDGAGNTGIHRIDAYRVAGSRNALSKTRFQEPATFK